MTVSGHFASWLDRSNLVRSHAYTDYSSFFYPLPSQSRLAEVANSTCVHGAIYHLVRLNWLDKPEYFGLLQKSESQHVTSQHSSFFVFMSSWQDSTASLQVSRWLQFILNCSRFSSREYIIMHRSSTDPQTICLPLSVDILSSLQFSSDPKQA